jgi:hypothetical protein
MLTKQEYYVYGEEMERKFVELVPCYAINPEKHSNKYAVDLINVCASSGITDLKTQGIQFRTSDRYGVPPEYAVTFTGREGNRYHRQYPSVKIVFWPLWLEQAFEVSLDSLKTMCSEENKHVYLTKEDPTQPATYSYVLDVRKMKRVL